MLEIVAPEVVYIQEKGGEGKGVYLSKGRRWRKER
jgi:hypothetical protein